MKINVNNVNIAMSAGDARQFPREPRPQIAFSGKSNVGKSSLINSLLGRKSMARVSSSPGKTVTVNFYDLDKKIFFVDLPGYGFASRSQTAKKAFSKVTEDYFLHNPSSDALRMVFQLIDVRTGPSDDDILMINFLIDNDLPFRVIATKTDKLSKAQLSAALEELKNGVFNGTGIEIIPYSSVTSEGKETVWNVINAALNV